MKSKLLNHLLLASSIVALAFPLRADTNILDFESINLPAGPVEGMAVSNQYLAQFGVSFRTTNGFPMLARKGFPTYGFFSGDLGTNTLYDALVPADTNVTAVGDYFLTRDNSRSSTIIMDFPSPVSFASGLIMDIDGSEVATITAYRDNGSNAVGSVVINAATPGAGSERAARWQFNHATNDIAQIRFVVSLNPGPFGIDLISSSFVPPPAPATNSLRLYPGVSIEGGVGRTYQIQFTNRVSSGQWIPLTNIILPSSPFIFFDATATNSTDRFYKVIGLP